MICKGKTFSMFGKDHIKILINYGYETWKSKLKQIYGLSLAKMEFNKLPPKLSQ